MSRVKKGMFAVRLFLIGALAAGLSRRFSSLVPGDPSRVAAVGALSVAAGGAGRTRTRRQPKARRTTAPVITTTTGILRAVAGNQFVIEADDHRIITYKIGDKMTVLRDAKPVELTSFATADHISVDSTADDMGFFTATGVTFNKPGTARERELAARTWDLPNLGASSAKPVAAPSAGTTMTTGLRCAAARMTTLLRSRKPLRLRRQLLSCPSQNRSRPL